MRKWDIRSVKRCSFIKTSRSEREKQTSYINTYTQNLEKETDEPVCRRGRETQTWRTDLRAQQGKQSVGQTSRVALAYTHHLHAAPLAVHSGWQIELTASGKLPTVEGR